jgi:hypothetical protein
VRRVGGGAPEFGGTASTALRRWGCPHHQALSWKYRKPLLGSCRIISTACSSVPAFAILNKMASRPLGSGTRERVLQSKNLGAFLLRVVASLKCIYIVSVLQGIVGIISMTHLGTDMYSLLQPVCLCVTQQCYMSCLSIQTSIHPCSPCICHGPTCMCAHILNML